MTTSLRTVHLTLPASTTDLAGLRLGDVVYLTGRVHTAREGVYKRAIEDGVALPAEIGSASFHCSPAASINHNGAPKVGAVTATASFRFSKWIKGWLETSGCNIVIGKGGMSSADYKRAFVPNNAIYLTTVGYGTGALLGRGIKDVAATHWLDELGLAQGIWVLDVENFGPFIVDSDFEGQSLFERENAKIEPGLKALYAGTKPPALRRFGETDRREDEVI
ncbi:MAG: fumarate hydratase C-terminal domain-containing protein [Hyphomicrobiales bacterium]|nr:fumarate hydratase C-terminal domain-containing protein [Hyphomicrobiales bacterium]